MLLETHLVINWALSFELLSFSDYYNSFLLQEGRKKEEEKEKEKEEVKFLKDIAKD